VRRRFVLPELLAADEPCPEDAWTPLLRPAKVVVPGDGPRARRLELIYEAPPEALGDTARVMIDGQEIASQDIAAISGALEAEVSAGPHTLAVEGLGRGIAYASAAPLGGGDILRRRSVYELTSRAPLQFAITQVAGEPLTLVLFVATEGAGAAWSLGYRVDDGAPRLASGRFFRVPTTPRGQVAGQSGDVGRGRIWEASGRLGPTLTDGLSKAAIALGDDLAPGKHGVTVWPIEAGAPLWLSAVVVGAEAGPRLDGARVWIAEDEP
jgi:hypothetical protein